MDKNAENKGKLLIVDDSEIDRAIITEIFKNDFEIVAVKNGYEAIGYLLENTEGISVIILDLFMPLMDGVDTLQKIKRIKGLELTPVIIMTAEAMQDSIKAGYDNGMADFIVKPIDRYSAYKRVMNIVELYTHKSSYIENSSLDGELEGLADIDNIKEYNSKTLNSIKKLYFKRNIESENHLKRVELIVESILQVMLNMGYKIDFKQFRLDDEKAKIVAKASLYHDIGLLSLPDAIVKSDINELTEEELKQYKSHPKHGTEMLRFNDVSNIEDYIELCTNIALYHHERIDGNGYPFGKKGEEIPTEAQVAGIAIQLDELICKYINEKEIFPFESAFNDLKSGKYGRFDNVLINCVKNTETNVKEIMRQYPEV